ncbi:TPA: hypothetical protein RG751_002738, partial [Enterococcus faecalis]|nr:hypothetical protein [Enterococcus faecalis]
NNKSEPFFQAFENFYFELKQHFFNEEDETNQLNERLEEMKIAFEQLTDDYNVL